MLIRKISMLAVTAILATGMAGVIAQEAFTPPATPQEAVAIRQSVMKQNGGILRSAQRLSGQDAVNAAATVLDNFTHMAALFPEGSEGGDALPAIWQNWDAFNAIIETGRAGAEAALAAAEAGDADGYTSGLRAVMATCNQCHDQFRS